MDSMDNAHRSRRLTTSLSLSICLIVLTAAAYAEASTSGQQTFNMKCSGCHALDSDKVGPRLRRVFGKPSGAVQSFAYSDAMKARHIVWDEATLDRWLTDPESVIPETDMSFRMENSQERAVVIEYLKNMAAK